MKPMTEEEADHLTFGNMIRFIGCDHIGYTDRGMTVGNIYRFDYVWVSHYQGFKELCIVGDDTGTKRTFPCDCFSVYLSTNQDADAPHYELDNHDVDEEPECSIFCANLPVGLHDPLCKWKKWNQKRKPRLS